MQIYPLNLRRQNHRYRGPMESKKAIVFARQSGKSLLRLKHIFDAFECNLDENINRIMNGGEQDV